jgi:hypothetical protein
MSWQMVRLPKDEVEALRSKMNELEPHEHHEGMNECVICDQSLMMAAVDMLEEYHEALRLISNNPCMNFCTALGPKQCGQCMPCIAKKAIK